MRSGKAQAELERTLLLLVIESAAVALFLDSLTHLVIFVQQLDFGTYAASVALVEMSSAEC